MNKLQQTLFAKTEFYPHTLQFDGVHLNGFMEVTDDVRETFYRNTVVSQDERELRIAGIQDMPIGVVMVNPEAVAPALFGQALPWTEGLDALQDGSFDSESMRLALVSMEGDAPASCLETCLSLTYDRESKNVLLRVYPLHLTTRIGFDEAEHAEDLKAAGCWLLQDIAASLYLNGPQDAKVEVEVYATGESRLDYQISEAFSLSLEGTRQAIIEEVVDGLERCQQVSLVVNQQQAA